MTPSYKDLFEFVLKNKGAKTFMGYSDAEIFDMLVDHLAQNDKFCLYYAVNEKCELVGVILFEVNLEDKMIFVTENLAMSLATLRQFAKMAKSRFPGFTLQWLKYGKLKQFNTEKFYRKLKV